MGQRLSLGIDIGTTSAQTVLITQDGHVVYQDSRDQNLRSPRPGWAEEDPAEWWENTLDLVQGAAEFAAGKGAKISCIGVSGMVPALVCLDGRGEPLRDSIQQNDARTGAEIRELCRRLGERRVFEATGSVISQQHIAPKVMWLERHEPEVFAQIRHVMGSYDYVTYKLTGEMNVEENWALESGFFHIAERSWLPDVLEASGTDVHWLPPVRNCAEVVGGLTESVARHVGLVPGTPVVAGVADHVASAFAAGVREQGDVNVKIGGAGDILLCLDEPGIDPRMFIDYHPIPGKFLINGCMASSGSVVKWFSKEVCGGNVGYEELDDAGKQLPPGSDGLIVLPYFVGEKTPIFDPSARGVIFGLSLHHNRAHIHRAILESVAYGFKHHIEVYEELGYTARRVVITDGGAKSPLWRQIVADVLGAPVTHLEAHPGSSLGAAFVAGRGTGFFETWEHIERFVRPAGTTDPDERRHAQYARHYRQYRQLYEHLKEDFAQMAGLQSSL